MSKILDLVTVYHGKKDKSAAYSYYSNVPDFYQSAGCIDILFDSATGPKRIRCGFFVNPVTLQFFCGSKVYKIFEDVTAIMDIKSRNNIGAPTHENIPHIPMKIDPNVYTMSNVNVLPTQPQKLVVFKPDDSFIARHK